MVSRLVAFCAVAFGFLVAAISPTAADDIANPAIVRGIQKRHGGSAAIHQTVQSVRIARVAAKQAMVAEPPQITGFGHDV